ncbi:hypothetical protein HOLleu_21040 [Holothuria leucospilota]|uniref:Integrase core domain-containing protein n=1 Tax=Holothuria leucospilota TaxID=206669 RepID=A0A9Q1H5R2_HOLLE|nr:hypothetical protein HOLleu_21040 [Holothuria leucospilota]
MTVRRDTLRDILAAFDPEGVRLRRRRRLVRRRIFYKWNQLVGAPRFFGLIEEQKMVGLRLFKNFFEGTETNQFAADRNFRYGASHHNRRIESWWAFLRKHWTQFLIEHFAKLSQDGYFDGSQLDKNMVQFCFSRLFQNELDRIAREWNIHPIRSSRNVNGLFGRPLVMYNAPDVMEQEILFTPFRKTKYCFARKRKPIKRPPL